VDFLSGLYNYLESRNAAPWPASGRSFHRDSATVDTTIARVLCRVSAANLSGMPPLHFSVKLAEGQPIVHAKQLRGYSPSPLLLLRKISDLNAVAIASHVLFGSVNIPQKAFIAVLRAEDD